jgi:hypothetical protein
MPDLLVEVAFTIARSPAAAAGCRLRGRRRMRGNPTARDVDDRKKARSFDFRDPAARIADASHSEVMP